MEKRAPVNRLATFLVILLLVMLPVSVSAQLSSIRGGEDSAEVNAQQPAPEGYSYTTQGDAGTQVICWPWDKKCNNQCWTNCPSGQTWYCGSTGAVCCYNSAKFCDSSAGKCWTNCPSGQTWNCGSSGAYCTVSCTDKDGDGYGSGCSKGSDCNDNDANINPGKSEACGDGKDNDCDGSTDEGCCAGNRECGGQCWTACSSGETWKCGSWGGAYCCGPSDQLCGQSCWKPCPSGQLWNCGSDGKAYCTTPCTDKDSDGYGSGCSKGSDCNDNDANVNPGKSEVCGDGKDNNCNDQTDEGCCSEPNPYNCAKTGTCWKKPQCDQSISCGGQWWACNEPSKYNPKCVNNNIGCCEPQYPYYCPANNWCFSQDGFCDGRKVYTCGSKSSVCNTKSDVGQCFGDTLRCCPPGETWWESDKQCHKSSEPQKCSVPDGSSANCDCDTDSECAKADASKPYCGETYGVRTSQGFHKCLSSKPEYCGNGNCGSGEDYKKCASDCAAPKGTISVDVYYSSGASANKPISGASVSLDGVPKGTTDSNGKKNFEASYGSRNVRVECPDSAFCAEKTVGVDGAKSVSFGCSCNPSTDSDGDGYSNEDEGLLGTNPKDANSNFKTTFASDSVDLLACIPTPVSFFILWKEYKKSGSIIQSHSLVVNSLNVTTVMSASFEEKPYVVAAALAAANLDTEGAEVIVNPVNVTLESVMKKAEYVDGVRMQDGILLIATDKDGQTTALIAIGAGCVGAFSGAVYGVGQGLFDDVKGVIDGIWFVLAHLGEVNKIWSGAKELVAGIAELGKNLDKTFWSMFNGILDKGKSINLFREGGLNQPEPYRHFQVGFVYGFVTGYLVEQVALGAVILSKVAKAFKLGQLFGKTGKAAKLMEKLAIIRGAEEFGAEIAEKLSKLKYLKEGIENWLDSEIKGLARIMKHNEDWLKGLSEAEAKVAAKHADGLVAAGKVSDAAFGDLAKTKLGQRTLKSADATTDLLAKQSKLVEKWGVKKADEVVTKCSFLIFCDTSRISDLNKVLKAMPDGIVDDLSPERAVKFLGDKKFVEAAEKLSKLCNSADTCLNVFVNIRSADQFEEVINGIKKLLNNFPKNIADLTMEGISKGVIDVTKVAPEKLARYIKALGKNPFDEALGEQKLVKMLNVPGKKTVIGTDKLDDVLILREGRKIDPDPQKIWGSDHIKYKHGTKLKEKFGKTIDDDDIKNIAEKVMDDGTPVKSTNEGIKEAIEKEIEYNGQKVKVRVAYFIKETDYGGVPGDIATVFIPD